MIQNKYSFIHSYDVWADFYQRLRGTLAPVGSADESSLVGERRQTVLNVVSAENVQHVEKKPTLKLNAGEHCLTFVNVVCGGVRLFNVGLSYLMLA